jgi:hypothetical protein
MQRPAINGSSACEGGALSELFGSLNQVVPSFLSNYMSVVAIAVSRSCFAFHIASASLFVW